MKILGIDPGIRISGFSIIYKDKQRCILKEAGFFKFNPKDSVQKRISDFYECIKVKAIDHDIDIISLETPFLGKNPQSFLKLGYLRGIIYLLAERNNIEVKEFAPCKVKKSLTGFGNSQKEQIAQVISRLFPYFAIPKKLDVTDAIAVALCAYWQSQTRF